MKPFLWLLTLFFPFMGESRAISLSLPGGPVTTRTEVSVGRFPGSKKQAFSFQGWRWKFFRSFIHRSTAVKSSDGRMLAAVSFAISLASAICWVVSPLAGLLASVPLGLLGLIFGIVGLNKANRWNGTKRTRILAILGIVLNALVIAFTLTIFVLFALNF